MSHAQTCDYIVVGAGSAGCVVANRLSEKGDVRVVLLEAGGPDDRPAIHEPREVTTLWGSELDWGMKTEAVPGLKGRSIPIARGKVLGGSSALFAMIHVRGNRRDFDHWNYLGNEGWSFADVLPYFKKLEDFERGPSEFHGTGGPVRIRYNPFPTPVAHAFTEAAVELGYGGPGWDFNAEQQENGAGLYQHTLTDDNKRASAAVAYLRPIVDRRNLSIRPGALVTRVLIEQGRASGVEIRTGGGVETLRAGREVVLCAGAFNSPQILMLSGVGPAAQLTRHGIEVRADLPGVGENLQDHLLLPVFYRSKVELPVPFFIAEAGLFVNTRPGLSAAAPDLQYHFGAGIPAFSMPGWPPHFAFVPILAKPQSRGTVSLRSADPEASVTIQPRYLESEADVRVLRHGVELARRLAGTRALARFSDGEMVPGTGVSEAELTEFIRARCSTVWHPVGTCKMGQDRLGVVDARLRVHGISGLRVADASIMPVITSGNTNAACMMIGEKAADLMLAES